MNVVQIIGRRSSLFTRLPLIFAETLGIAYEVVPVADMTELSAAVYADNPALKLPVLRVEHETVFGALNICRTLVERAASDGLPARVVWPEDLRDTASRNAQEMIWHAMAAQVQLVMGTVLAKLPADSIYFVKNRRGLEGALRWLDAHADAVIARLDAARTLSVFESSLLCLVEHLQFRDTIPTQRFHVLTRFARDQARHAAVRATTYRFE